ncbi:porin [Longimicrobium sp.]|uniref:porin n=1 Tax=Longimicrobium sp. TaxID=2029185 RepID=UPI002B5F0B2F|nr:porin [Longimicrobium sp.]HSU15338.1 porin [Longimicrobium sp.]
MKMPILASLAALALPAAALAQAGDTTAHVTFGAFVDGYYAYDFNRPAGHDRPFTTQASRHDEFNLNLAHVEAKYQSSTVRGRLALQAGTSVQVNYAFEPDSLAGLPNYLPLVQEAWAGVAISPTLWVDAGIFLSHIGSEGWISMDQPTYTRSLVADYSVYYEAGVRASWQATPSLAATFVVVNGWQNISENNHDKAVGARLDWTASPAVIVSYSNFVGREPGAATGDQDLRVLNDLSARITAGPLLVVPTVDVGTQDGDTWYGASLVGRYALTPTVALNGRVERYDDRHGVLTPGLRTNGASLGIDVARGPALWRTEVRALFGADDGTFPAHGAPKSSDVAAVTSLAVRF